ncbi:hypothetical protein DXG01_014419 [Tephrocybe rancida]|nr:hypothetical protein DXG01_014419 [Tephrocybe rancida]
MPLSRRRVYGNLNAVRDLQREMEDLSDEETELEDILIVKLMRAPLQNLSIHNRGYAFLVPIGRNLTQQEEKNDADEDSEDSGSGRSGGAPSVIEDDGENDSAPDLDASMEDMDEEGAESDENDETAEAEGDTEDFEEEPSEA